MRYILISPVKNHPQYTLSPFLKYTLFLVIIVKVNASHIFESGTVAHPLLNTSEWRVLPWGSAPLGHRVLAHVWPSPASWGQREQARDLPAKRTSHWRVWSRSCYHLKRKRVFTNLSLPSLDLHHQEQGGPGTPRQPALPCRDHKEPE